MEFEWDEAKAEANLTKHGVDFREATRVFRDIHAVDGIDQSMNYGEERFLIVGLVNAVMIAVFYTERGDKTRIISARPATKSEQRKYDEERR